MNRPVRIHIAIIIALSFVLRIGFVNMLLCSSDTADGARFVYNHLSTAFKKRRNFDNANPQFEKLNIAEVCEEAGDNEEEQHSSAQFPVLLSFLSLCPGLFTESVSHQLVPHPLDQLPGKKYLAISVLRV